MIANFFNKTKPVIIVNLIILFAVFYFVSTFLFHSIEISAYSIGLIFAKFLCFVFMLLVINFILRKNNLTEDNSYALLIVVLLLAGFYETMFEANLFFANLILLLAFRKIYSIGSGFNTKMKLFDAGFWIGVSAIIYSWSILFLLLVYVGMILYRKLSVKNLFIPIVGLITPIVIFFTYHFYFDKIDVFYERFNFDFSLDFGSYNALKFVIPIALLLTLLIWGVITLIPRLISVSINFKLAWQVLINHLLISLIIVVFSPIKNGSEIFFLIFPSAIIITNFLQRTESSTFKNLILYLFLVISVSVYFL